MQITLVSDNDNWDPIRTSVIQNLVANNLDHVKAQFAGDGVYENVSVNIKSVLAIEDGELVLREYSVTNILSLETSIWTTSIIY